jgi:predicted alternative tryptophan synthase beta-subunit
MKSSVMKDEATIIINNDDKYIYILFGQKISTSLAVCGGQDKNIQDIRLEMIKQQMNVALINESFIRKKTDNNQFTDQIINADYLIVNEPLDLYKLHKLNYGNMKELIHGDGYVYHCDGVFQCLSAKKLIIISNHDKQKDIFKDELTLRMRCKFI